jgi:hypothetical protein
MKLSLETLSLFATVKKRIDRANKIIENASDLLEPIVKAAIERHDPEELNELVRKLPCDFWQGEIRRFLMSP